MGVQKDYRHARKCYSAAAEEGIDEAFGSLCDLGMALENMREYEMAEKCYVAAENNLEEARDRLTDLRARMKERLS